MKPGETGFVQLRLASPVYLCPETASSSGNSPPSRPSAEAACWTSLLPNLKRAIRRLLNRCASWKTGPERSPARVTHLNARRNHRPPSLRRRMGWCRRTEFCKWRNRSAGQKRVVLSRETPEPIDSRPAHSARLAELLAGEAQGVSRRQIRSWRVTQRGIAGNALLRERRQTPRPLPMLFSALLQSWSGWAKDRGREW